MYEKMSAEWKEMAFEVLPYKDNKDYFVIGSTEELEDVLENSIMQLSSIIQARFGDKIRSKEEKFQKELQHLQEVIDQWRQCQKSWIYLNNIFESPDIARSLPEETKKMT